MQIGVQDIFWSHLVILGFMTCGCRQRGYVRDGMDFFAASRAIAYPPFPFQAAQNCVFHGSIKVRYSNSGG